MTIAVGDRLPDVTFRVMTADGPAAKTTAEVFSGKKVVLFAVPGAFTPTCHKNHLPGYLARYDEIKAKGVDSVAVTGVNDVFVMNA
ncbi:redoxin family protein, partial [Nostoc sp. NIES-2111]